MNLPTKPLHPRDQAWVSALRRYDTNGYVMAYKNPDGTVDAETTIDRLMEMYDIKPKIPAPPAQKAR